MPLGAVARLDIERVRVRPGESYRIAGVLNAGQGVFERGPIDGASTNYTALHRLRAGQLVMRKLTAWEGPITVVPPGFGGFFASPEFPTYTLNDDLDPRFMTLICQLPVFWDAMRLRSTGTVQRRKRVNPDELLRVEIDVPPLIDQRRIVNLARCIDEAAGRSTRLAAAALRALRSTREATLDWSGPAVPLRDLCSVSGSLINPTAPGFRDLPHIGVDRIEARTGRLLELSTAAGDGVTSGKYCVDEGDVVYAKIRPELRKVALPGFQAVCSADAYPLRPADGVDPRFLLELLLSDRFSAIAVAKSGRTKMPKINREELFSIEVPATPPAAQQRIGSLLAAIRAVADRADREARAIGRLRQVVLSGLLRGSHKMPASYDRLLDSSV